MKENNQRNVLPLNRDTILQDGVLRVDVVVIVTHFSLTIHIILKLGKKDLDDELETVKTGFTPTEGLHHDSSRFFEMLNQISPNQRSCTRDQSLHRFSE